MRIRSLVGLLLTLSLATPAQAIVNGSVVTPGDWSFMVAVGCSSNSTAKWCADRRMGADDKGMNAPQFCGGTLIAPQIVVTAAHCIFQNTGEQLTAADLIVGGGLIDLTKIKAATTYSTVASVTVHPKYNKTSQAYDVAILTLNKQIANTSPIAYSPKLAKAGEKVQVAGWGEIDDSGSSSPIANVVTLEVYSDEECDAKVGTTFDKASMQCALGKSGTKWLDACQGDSGGPMIGTIDGTRMLVGSVSWGARCADGKPGIYAKLPTMLPEVLQITPPPPAAVDIKQTKPGTPGTPKNVKIARNGSATIMIPAPTDGQDVEFWTVSCSSKAGKFQSQASSLDFVVGGLRPKTVFTCKVNATNSLGTSAWSKPFKLS